MKLLYRFAGVMLLFAGTPICSQAQTPVPIQLATHDQAPYGSYLPDHSFNGIAVRVMSCVLKRMGRVFSIKVYPWERAQMLAEKGKVDGFFPATIKAERLQWAEASDVIADQKWVWYLPANSKFVPATAEFKTHAKVGAHFGSNRLKMLVQEHYQVVRTPQSDALLLKAFVAGHADAILGGNLAIADAMQQQGIKPDTYKTVIAKDNPLHAYFGHQFLQTEPDFLVHFNAQLPACR
jgi:polar amino acid transport system substrate-binding protein